MRRAAFAIGYAGGILALVCALLMIYTVPAGVVDGVLTDMGSGLENGHIVALGDMLSQDEWPPLDREAYEEFADRAADDSRLPLDKDVYEQSALFVYRAGMNALVSAILIGVSILLALVAFFGALAVRRRPAAGGALMLAGAVMLLVAALCLGTAIPTALPCLLLAAAGVLAFIPEKAPATGPYALSGAGMEDGAAPVRVRRRGPAPARIRRDHDID